METPSTNFSAHNTISNVYFFKYMSVLIQKNSFLTRSAIFYTNMHINKLLSIGVFSDDFPGHKMRVHFLTAQGHTCHLGSHLSKYKKGPTLLYFGTI
jgi:hypothetical protein